MKHTKGEWTYSEATGTNNNITYFDLRANGMLFGSTIPNEYPYKNLKEISLADAKENAKLISKAPIFLEYIEKKAKEGCSEAIDILSES